MTVTTSLPATGIVRSLGDQSVKLSAVLNNRPVSTNATDDSSLLASQSAQVDAQASEQYPPLSLRINTATLANAGSKADEIGTTLQQVSGLLAQLQSLAGRASLDGLSRSAMEGLAAQFQAVRLSINNLPPQPPQAVSVSSLLESAPGGLDTALGQQALAANLQIGGLNNDKVLLGDANIDTPEAAQQALGIIAGAFDKVGAQSTVTSQVQEVIEFAAASTDGALANQEALRSTLTEGDLDGTSTTPSLVAALQAQSENARLVQTSRLPNNVLQLLG